MRAAIAVLVGLLFGILFGYLLTAGNPSRYLRSEFREDGGVYTLEARQSQLDAQEVGIDQNADSILEHTNLRLRHRNIHILHESSMGDASHRYHSCRVGFDEEADSDAFVYLELPPFVDDSTMSATVRLSNVRHPRDYYLYDDYEGDGQVEEIARFVEGVEQERWVIVDSDWLRVQKKQSRGDLILESTDGSHLQASYSREGWQVSPAKMTGESHAN